MEAESQEHGLDKQTSLSEKIRNYKKKHVDNSYMVFGHINVFEKSGYVDRVVGEDGNVFVMIDGDLETPVRNMTDTPTEDLVGTVAMVFGSIEGAMLCAYELYAFDRIDGYMVAGGDKDGQRKGEYAWAEGCVCEESAEVGGGKEEEAGECRDQEDDGCSD